MHSGYGVSLCIREYIYKFGKHAVAKHLENRSSTGLKVNVPFLKKTKIKTSSCEYFNVCPYF